MASRVSFVYGAVGIEFQSKKLSLIVHPGQQVPVSASSAITGIAAGQRSFCFRFRRMMPGTGMGLSAIEALGDRTVTMKTALIGLKQEIAVHTSIESDGKLSIEIQSCYDGSVLLADRTMSVPLIPMTSPRIASIAVQRLQCFVRAGISEKTLHAYRELISSGDQDDILHFLMSTEGLAYSNNETIRERGGYRYAS